MSSQQNYYQTSSFLKEPRKSKETAPSKDNVSAPTRPTSSLPSSSSTARPTSLKPMTFQNISDHFLPSRSQNGSVPEKSVPKGAIEGSQSLSSGRDLLKNRPLPKIPDSTLKKSEPEISEHQKLKDKVKSKEKLTLREQIKLLSKKLDVKASGSTEKEKLPLPSKKERETLSSHKAETQENENINVIEPNTNARTSLEEVNSKSKNGDKSAGNQFQGTDVVPIDSEKTDNSEAVNEVYEAKKDHNSEQLQHSLPSTPKKLQAAANETTIHSPPALLSKFFPGSFFSPSKDVTSVDNSKGSSLMSPSYDKEELIEVQQVEEFMSSMVDIIRSLFTFTEDLELKIEYYILLATSLLPSKLQTFLHFLSPVLKQFALLLELFFVLILIILELLVELSSFLWNYSKNESPELVLGMVFGFLFCFFGSFFITTIAAFEAFRLFGYDRLLQSVKQINDDLKKLKHSSKRFSAALLQNRTRSISSNPDFTDATNIDQASSTKSNNDEKLSNLTYPSLPPSFLLQSTFTTLASINPNHLFQAIFVLNAGFFAALTTLKIQFAKTITLGNSIGTLLEKPVFYVCQPLIDSFFPDELQQWGTFFVRMSLKFLSISISWTLQKFLSLFHSSIRGGLLISKNLFEYLIKYQIIKRYFPNKIHFLQHFIHSHKTRTIFGVGYLLAIFGMYFQFVYRNALPFPFNYLFSPVLFFERTLVWMVNNSSFIFQNM